MLPRTYRFRCPACGTTFEKDYGPLFLTPHIVGVGIRVRCPSCGKAHWLPPLSDASPLPSDPAPR